MALTIQTVISAITILEDAQIHVRRSRRVFEDAEMVAERYHRRVLGPGDDTTQEDPRVRAVANLLWTPAVIDAYKAAKAARRIT